ncbi:MAG: hypothetical protein KKI08_01895 [Armatimonadetes bacterium]|nr:hypothetical protein [Armatimonadota bacterium]
MVASSPSRYTAAEQNGDGDGVIGSDEDVRVSWTASDPSGIGASTITVDGASATIQGTYYADLGKFTIGTHSVTVTVTDVDISPESRESTFTFSVVPCEAISVGYGVASVSNGAASLVNLGMFSQNVPPAPALFTVRNDGEQKLVLGALAVSGPLTKNDPGTTNITPSGFTTFDLVPATTAAGAFTGTVTLANSDTAQSPFTFMARYEVRQDTDDDGVPDSWELAYFPGLGNVTTNSNSDGDPLLDKDEFVAGTDPTDEEDYFRIGNCVAPSAGGGEVVIVWDTVTGRLYRVHTTTNLLGLWSNVLQRAGNDAPMSYTNDLPTPAGRFFKLDVRLQE